MAEWQDIASAPKDGTRVLLYFPRRGIANRFCVGWWSLSQSVFLSEPGLWRREPTHWLPLPTPPETTA